MWARAQPGRLHACGLAHLAGPHRRVSARELHRVCAAAAQLVHRLHLRPPRLSHGHQAGAAVQPCLLAAPPACMGRLCCPCARAGSVPSAALLHRICNGPLPRRARRLHVECRPWSGRRPSSPAHPGCQGFGYMPACAAHVCMRGSLSNGTQPACLLRLLCASPCACMRARVCWHVSG